MPVSEEWRDGAGWGGGLVPSNSPCALVCLSIRASAAQREPRLHPTSLFTSGEPHTHLIKLLPAAFTHRSRMCTRAHNSIPRHPTLLMLSLNYLVKFVLRVSCMADRHGDLTARLPGDCAVFLSVSFIFFFFFKSSHLSSSKRPSLL